MFHEAPRIIVSASDLENQASSCPFCNEANAVGTGVYAQDEPPVEYLQCHSCLAYFSDRVPTARYLERFYHHALYEGTISKSEALAKRLAKSILSGPIHAELADTCSELSVMDFGGGSGRLGLAIKHRLGRPDTRVTLVDLYQPSEGLRINFLTPGELTNSYHSQFDLIVLSAVIEHLAQPGAIVADLYQRVRSGGVYLFSGAQPLPVGKGSSKPTSLARAPLRPTPSFLVRATPLAQMES